MTNAFEYGDALMQGDEPPPTPMKVEVSANTEPHPSPIPTNQPYINLAT